MSRSRTPALPRLLRTGAALFTLLAAASAVALPPPPLQVVSRPGGGGDALLGAAASRPAVSADGRYVAFISNALDYLPATPGTTNVFLKDVLTGQIDLISRAPEGPPGDGSSYACVMTPDARYIAFESRATNLVPNDTNGKLDVFVYDRVAATMERVNVNSQGQQAHSGTECFGCENLAITPNGRYVAFHTRQRGLVFGDGGNDYDDVFVRDRLLGLTEQASVRGEQRIGGNGHSGQFGFSITPDGRHVVFPSYATNLVLDRFGDDGDTNNDIDIYLRDREEKMTERITVTPGGGQPFLHSYAASVRADGQFVVFQSRSSNLVDGSKPNIDGIYLRDRHKRINTRIDRGPGGESAQLQSFEPVFTPDGRYVLYCSLAPNLVPGDSNQRGDVFLCDLQQGTTELVSVSTGGVQGNGDSGFGNYSISPDARFIAFASDAGNLAPGDTNGRRDVFLRDRAAGTTVRVSEANAAQTVTGATSRWPAVSSEGQFVAFVSTADNLVPNDTNGVADVFVVETGTGVVERVSVASGGGQGNAPSGVPSLSSDSILRPAITPDGRYVAFRSHAANLVPGDTNGTEDYFVRDRKLGLTERINVDSQGGQALNEGFLAGPPAITPDGRYVAFESSATNFEPEKNGPAFIFVRDRKLGRTELVSLGKRDLLPNRSCHHPSLSDDGRFVSFETSASNIPPLSNASIHHVYVRDRRARTLERVAIELPTPFQIRYYTHSGQLSGDGRFIAFVSEMHNLVPGDTNSSEDVFVRDLPLKNIERISVAAGGAQLGRGGFHPSLSRNGRYVAFVSESDGVTAGDTNGLPDVFVRDRLSGQVDRASAAADGDERTSHVDVLARMVPALSPEGYHVAFDTAAALRSDDTNGTYDIYLRALGGPVPDAPRGLRARVQGGQVLLAWQHAGAPAFVVERQAGSGAFVEQATTGADARTFTDSALTAGVVYTYRVVAVNARGRSGPSNLVSAGLPALPEAPEGLLATAEARGIRLDWADRSTIERGFSLERREGDAPYRLLRTLPRNTTTYRDLRVRAGVQYTYRVRATHPKGFSPYSNEASALAPP